MTIILINIDNNKEVLELLLELIVEGELGCGWKIESNAHWDNMWWSKYPNKVAKYFSFNLDNKTFTWHRADEYEEGDDTIADYELIDTTDKVIELLLFIRDNYDSLMERQTTPVETPIETTTTIGYINPNLKIPLILKIPPAFVNYVNNFCESNDKVYIRN